MNIGVRNIVVSAWTRKAMHDCSFAAHFMLNSTLFHSSWLLAILKIVSGVDVVAVAGRDLEREMQARKREWRSRGRIIINASNTCM
ncbi:hypothetical protein AB3S75_004444 [Citrus x aurantiifolia]